MSPPVLETIECTLSRDGVALIAFNRPNKANCISPQMYLDWRNALRWAANDDEVIVAVITGKGRFFCAGQELGDEMNVDINDRTMRSELVAEEYIKFPKLLVAAVNAAVGPAIGMGCTTLALCDVIYSVPHATFNTPFMELGFCAESCSSVTFPHIFGLARANEILILGRKCTAEEFERWGFISRIIPAETFLADVLEIATRAAKLPRNAVLQTKNLVKATMKKELLETNRREMRLLAKRFTTETTRKEIGDAIEAFVIQQEAKKKAKL
ncbi:ClpP/crotonase-like domain-containing protein [Cladochytrium replicatum]|nr:ClpP/crotonase-like domain-containing protein [Cladochytrium replicatum]